MPNVGKRTTKMLKYVKEHSNDWVPFILEEERLPAATAQGEGLTVGSGPPTMPTPVSVALPGVSSSLFVESTSSSQQTAVEPVERSSPVYPATTLHQPATGELPRQVNPASVEHSPPADPAVEEAVDSPQLNQTYDALDLALLYPAVEYSPPADPAGRA